MVLKLTWAQKQMFLTFAKDIFQFFCKFLSDAVETIFWESEAKRSKLFKSKFGHKELFRKWFWSFLKLDVFEKSIFQFFANFWVTMLKPFFWEARLSSKTNVLSVWKEHFQFFASFWLTKLKPFPGKVRQGVQNYLNQNLVIGSFFKNGFEATLSWKTNVLSIWKGHFSIFCKFLSDEVETIFWERETKRSKLFKLKFDHKELLRKWFLKLPEARYH